MPRSSPYPYLFLSWLHKQVSILFGRCSCGFQSHHPLSSSLLQDLGCIVPSLHVVVQGNMYHITLNNGGVQGGTCPKRMASLFVLQRSRSLKLSIPNHNSVELQASPTNLCLVRQVPTQLHQLSAYTLSSHMASSSSLSDFMVEFSSLSTHPCFKCSARNFLCDLMSGPSCDVLLLPVPSYLLPSPGCHL